MHIEFLFNPVQRQLKIVDPLAKDLGSQFGIGRVRQAEIACEINRMVSRFGNAQVRTCEVLNQIAGFCHTEEETLWASLFHQSQLARGGFIL
jgi:hypothetical protein